MLRGLEAIPYSTGMMVNAGPEAAVLLGALQ